MASRMRGVSQPLKRKNIDAPCGPDGRQRPRSWLLDRQVDAVDLPAAVQARGLAYQAEVPVNWCPALGTVLANEEVIGAAFLLTLITLEP